MFRVTVVLLVFSAVSALPRPEEEKKYNMKIYENFETLPISEVEDILDCVINGKSCNPSSVRYRAAYPEVVINACEQCSEDIKRAAYAFYNRVSKDLPQRLTEFKQKFDPEGKYYEAFYNVLKASAQ